MRDPATREKMKNTLQRIGHKPIVRGGNGTLIALEWQVCDALNAAHRGWCMRQVIRTGGANGLPAGVKLDLSNPWLKVAVELDGGSHAALERQEQDLRKRSFLHSCGWTVLSFANRQVVADMTATVDEILRVCSTLK